MRCSWAIVLAACGGGSAHEEEESRPVATVTCKATQQITVDEVVEVTGVIAPPPKLDAILSAPVAGRISQVAVEEGDKVAAGALLVTIDDPSLPAGAAEASAGVAAARAAVVVADQELVRQQRLVDTGIGARRDLDEAHAKAASARAELAAANARAGLASKNNARRELRAPYAGVVLHLWKRTGEVVDGTSATPIVEVADVSTLEVRAQVPPAAMMPIRDGMLAKVTLVGVADTLAAKVVRVAPAVDPATLLGTVRIQLDGTRALPIGTLATATITTATHPGLLVPSTALRRSIVGADEVVVCAKGVAQVRTVTARPRTDGTSEVIEGLAAGDHIVTDHVLGLEEGQKLAEPK